ncbi:MAG: molybdopterin-dependent oxidoreductase [Desulfobacterales bacterium]|nr:molybdopterin-dependent oxidoreductase [Desulfobacterales bacterium]
MKTVTACTMDCPDACSLIVSTGPDGEIRLRGNPDHPVTRGFTCKKIHRHIERLRSPERIVHPLLKKSGGWQEIGWDHALDLCAEKIDECRSAPESILHIQSAGAQGALKQVPRLFFNRIGATRVKGSLCDAAGFAAFLCDFGSRKNHDIADLANASRIVNWGRDLPKSSIHMAAIVAGARKKGTRVLTISPGGDDSDSFSDDHIRIRPGTDRFLAAAALCRWLETEPADPLIPKRSRHWHRFEALLRQFTNADLLSACKVAQKDLEKLLRWYRVKTPAATIVGTGLQRYRFGGENVRWINALAMISGNIGRIGGGSYYHLGSYAHLNLDWTEKPAPKSRRTFAEPTLGRQIQEAGDPPIRMAWVNGFNIVNQAPDSKRTARALKWIPFTVVVDAFLTDTADCADLVLPSALMLEQEDVVGSFLHDYVQYVPAVMNPPGKARTDDRIMIELAGRLSPALEMPTRQDCLARSLLSTTLSVSLDELKKKGAVRADTPEIAYEGLCFDHPDGKYRFPPALHPEPGPPEGYPLRLLSLIRKEAVHSQMLVEDQSMPPTAWVAPDCPELERMEPNAEAFIVSPLGRLSVRLQTLPGLHPEAVIYRRGDWMKLGGGINRLIEDGITDIGRGAPFYDQYVRIERR